MGHIRRAANGCYCMIYYYFFREFLNKMFSRWLILGVCMLAFGSLYGQGSGVAHTAAANVRVMEEAFSMPQFGRTRRIWVYLPADYDTTSKRYPVLYMHDGQNLFDNATSSSEKEWKVDEALNKFFEEDGQESIIVIGIEHDQEYRNQEYAPWVNDEHGGGRGEDYARFVVETLKPYVDQQLRTKPQRQYTGIAGSSLGGIISIYTGLEYPEIFGMIGAISPVVWFNPEILDYVDNRSYTQDTRIYFVTSELEGSSVIGGINTMYESLLAQGHKPENVKKMLTAQGNHSETYFSNRFPDMYQWLYQPAQRSANGEDPEEPEEPELPEEPTGLEEVDPEKNGIKAYPNPTGGTLQLVLPEAWKGQARAYFTDLQGKMIGAEALLPSDLQVSVESLPQGLYFLIITTPAQRAVLRVIKE